MFVTIVCVVSTAWAFPQKISEGLIAISLRNTSMLPKKFTVVSYQPGETGNGTNGFVLLPGSEKRLQFKEGTKLYLASNQQVDRVMSGQRIDADTPFLTVKKQYDGKIFKL